MQRAHDMSDDVSTWSGCGGAHAAKYRPVSIGTFFERAPGLRLWSISITTRRRRRGPVIPGRTALRSPPGSPETRAGGQIRRERRVASLCASLAPNMATSTRPLRVLWKREDATKISALHAIGAVVRVPAHKWVAAYPRHRRAARNGLRAPGSRGTASRRRRGGASCGAKRREKGEDLRPCEPMHGVSSAWIATRMGS